MINFSLFLRLTLQDHSPNTERLVQHYYTNGNNYGYNYVNRACKVTGKGLQSKLTFLNFLLFLISCSCVKPCNSTWIPSMIASWLTCHFGHSRCKPCAQQYIELCNIVQTFFSVFFSFFVDKNFLSPGHFLNFSFPNDLP